MGSIQDLSTHPTHYPHALYLLRRPADDCASNGTLASGLRPRHRSSHIVMAKVSTKHAEFALACCCLFLCSITACPPVLPVIAHSGCSMLSGTCKHGLHEVGAQSITSRAVMHNGLKLDLRRRADDIRAEGPGPPEPGHLLRPPNASLRHVLPAIGRLPVHLLVLRP